MVGAGRAQHTKKLAASVELAPPSGASVRAWSASLRRQPARNAGLGRAIAPLTMGFLEKKPAVICRILTVKDRLTWRFRGGCSRRPTPHAGRITVLARARAESRVERCARPVAVIHAPARLSRRLRRTRSYAERARDRRGGVRQGHRLRSEPGFDGARLRAQPPPEARALLCDGRARRAAAAGARPRRISRVVGPVGVAARARPAGGQRRRGRDPRRAPGPGAGRARRRRAPGGGCR